VSHAFGLVTVLGAGLMGGALGLALTARDEVLDE